LLGDKGSAYEIGLRGLKAIVYYYDRDGAWPRLGSQLLRALQLNQPNDLIAWAQQADKKDIAALATEVFAACQRRDRIATDILEGAAQSLASDAASCARKLTKKGEKVQFVLAGGVLANQPQFAKRVAQLVRKLCRPSKVTLLEKESVWGAVRMARECFARTGTRRPVRSLNAPRPERDLVYIPEATALSPTERRNPRSSRLDQLPVNGCIELMLSEEAKVPSILLTHQATIGRAIQHVVKAFRRGGRLFYVGAGTSGRIGALDASECPPTFRVPADQVQGIMAGGQQALWQSLEGAEDDSEAGADAIRFRGVNRKDVVVGIAASGRTPFVWGALGEARRRHATTMLVCFNPYLKIAPAHRPDLVLAADLGPEILTGSTRLKAGTATKLLLNLFTTVSMAKLGKVVSNLMVDLNPSNSKLRDRALRIVQDLTGCDPDAARNALQNSGWVIKAALQRLDSRPSKPKRKPRILI
jgi:N-acetylmuramic acid 6-phosphate etherase